MKLTPQLSLAHSRSGENQRYNPAHGKRGNNKKVAQQIWL
jgi:hypothetical protein